MSDSPLENFVPARCFTGTGVDKHLLQMHPRAMSDHGEIGVLCGGLRIYIINLSNPDHHDRMDFAGRPALSETHLYKNVKAKPEWLQSKYDEQAAIVAERLKSSIAQVYILTEATASFLGTLRSALGPDYVLVPDPDELSPTSTRNVSCVVARRDIVCRRHKKTSTYQDEKGLERTQITPYIIAETNIPGFKVAIAAVHLAGNTEQYPATAVRALNDQWAGPLFPGVSMHILAGDWNTVPRLARASAPGLTILEPQYLTHVNPRTEAAVYDMVGVWAQDSAAEHLPQPLPLHMMPDYTQRFVECLHEAAGLPPIQGQNFM